MSDSEAESERTALKIPRFHGRRGEDYGLWRLRLRAACRVKGLWSLVEKKPTADAEESTRQDEMTAAERHRQTAKLEKASGIIITALGNSPLRVVADVDDDPARMLELLDARYASNRTVSRIAVQTQLFRMRYTGQDMSKYIDEYASLFSQLEFMGKDVAIPEAHKAPMLLASIEPTCDLEPIAAALRTKDAQDLTWAYVTTTLIDEHNARRKMTSNNKVSRKFRGRTAHKAKHAHVNAIKDADSSSDESVDIEAAARTLAAAIQSRSGGKSRQSSVICDFCEKPGHTEPKCFMNPDNPNNKLPSRMKERMMISASAGGSGGSGSSSKSGRRGGGTKKVEFAGAIISSTVEKTTILPPKDHNTYHDSGATSHVFHSESAFVPGSLRECAERTVILADKSSVIASQVGNVLLEFEFAMVRLSNVLFIPGLGYNLVSVGKLADNGIESTFRKSDVVLQLSNKDFVVGHGSRDSTTGLYSLPNPQGVSVENVAALPEGPHKQAELWHRRLGHLNAKDLCNIHKHADGVPQLHKLNDVCRACRLGKAHKLPFKGHFERAKSIGDLIHSDIVGPLQPSFPDRYKYAATFQDDHSRFAYVGFMRNKSDLPSVFHAFALLFHRVTQTRLGVVSIAPDCAQQFPVEWGEIKRLHSDNAKEYISLPDFGGGMEKSYCPPYTPELNAVAERINRTLGDATRSMLIQADLPTCLWPFAMKNVVYVRNRVPHSATGLPPFTVLQDSRPSLARARVFGCRAYVLKLPRGSKLEARAREGVLLEILDHGVYKVLVASDDGAPMVVKSRHVTFDESEFPGAKELEHYMSDEDSDDETWEECDDSEKSGEISLDISTPDDEEVPNLIEDEDDDDEDDDDDDDNDDDDNGDIYNENNDNDDADYGNQEELPQNNDPVNGVPPQDPEPTPTHRYPRRNRNPPPAWYMAASSNSVPITTSDDPTVREAMNASPEESELWSKAIEDEFSSLDDKETWEPDDDPQAKPLPTHIVLKVKRDKEGDVDRFKARVVAGGNHQTHGEDYFDTYAPVVHFSVVRIFLYIAVCLSMFIAQVDIKTAFLNGVLEEDVWVWSPRGIPEFPSRLYKLKKALYGLKQAHLAWHKRFVSDLQSMGFEELSSAPCVFRRKSKSFWTFILVYVDDLIVMSQEEKELDAVLGKLKSLYELRVSKEVDFFLGVRLKWNFDSHKRPTTLHLSQRAYTEGVLRRFGMFDSKPAPTPMTESFFSCLGAEKYKAVVDVKLYEQIIGSLLYLGLRTRPDILVAVLILARFQNSPTAFCHRAAKRLLRYLKGSVSMGFDYTPGNMDFVMFVDSDHAADITDRKSTSGYIGKVGKAIVHWGARKQNSTALSTCEAEYVAMSVAARRKLCGSGTFWPKQESVRMDPPK